MRLRSGRTVTATLHKIEGYKGFIMGNMSHEVAKWFLSAVSASMALGLIIVLETI